MKKVIYSKEGHPFSTTIKDRVVKVYPKIRGFIPRLIKYQSKYYFDLRYFKMAGAELVPTKFGFRLGTDDFFKLMGIVKDISKRLRKRGVESDD